ncbi:MAG: CNNM domain-containing protein [Merdibacter sp.]
MARLSCNVVRGVAFVMKPVISLLSLSTNAILRLLHLKTEAQEDSVSEEEIRMMVDLGEKRGVLDEEEKEWITNVFEFDDTPVKDIMVRANEVVAIAVDATKEEILKLISDEGVSRIPVYGSDLYDIVGVLYAKDFLIELQKERPFSLRNILRDPYFVPEQVTADVLFKDMQTRKIRFAIVRTIWRSERDRDHGRSAGGDRRQYMMNMTSRSCRNHAGRPA